MTKSMKKDFRREVRNSLTRFLSIMLIVVLGVAFFAGIKSTPPAMRASADATYDNENFMDIMVQGTLGVTDKDIYEISKIENVRDAEGAYSADFLCRSPEAEVITSVISLTDRLNLAKVTEGRFPRSYDECIADRQFLEKSGYAIGDEITLYTGDGSLLSDTLATNKFTIVGVGSTAYYLSTDRGTTDIGSGVVDAFLIVPKEAFVQPTFSKIFVKVDGAEELNCFSLRYKNLIKNVKENIEAIAETRCDVRYSEFRAEAISLVTQAEARFEAQKQRAIAQYESAYQELADAQAALDAAQLEIDSKKQEIEDAQDLLDLQESSLPERKEQIKEAKKTLVELTAQYNTTSQQLSQANAVVEKMEEELRQSASRMKASEYAEAAFTIYSWKATGQLYQTQLDGLKVAIDQANKRVESAEQILNGSPEAIADARNKLAQGEDELKNVQRTVTEKQEKLNEAKEEYELSKEDMATELDDAQAKLDSYKDKIENTPVPKWYVTGREAVGTYASFDNDAQGISAIGTVFPIIFFLVAALVSLTTMTRMVEEQRMQIGTLKSMGYSKRSITSKYIFYAFFATLLGAVIGVGVGESVIPSIVIETYKIVYVNLTQTVVPFNIFYALIATAIALACTTGAAYFAGRRNLKQSPASLMRPEAPTSGKKIFLEKIKFFWIRLNFAQRAALRNMVRYKKRLFMTLFGVAGCMALLLLGFGIRDSVASMTERQFNEIWNYQGTVTVNEGLTRTERRHVLAELQSVVGVTDYLQTYRTPTLAVKGEEEQNAYILVPQSADIVNDYIALRNRVTKTEYALDDNSVIITEKLAKLLGVGVGDTISFKADENSQPTAEITVGAITENYLYHYIYMTPAVYNSIFGQTVSLNTILLRSNAEDDSEFAKKILHIDGVTSVTMNSITQAQVDETMDNLKLIVALMIISAALLAFVVLYNLNNINITERKRELATLKVLGFYKDELERYVYRENAIMTFFGIILGILIGIVLHIFVMHSVETDTTMFGIQIKWYSFLISVLLTAVFSSIVNILMSFKLKRINKVESLKSVE
ncbi:MAG TPA: hypothetical protein DCR23_02755 [Ruminococcaceae bacterium]|nr:hypothetical protein [Oscillospiraceae bacterium]